MSNIAPQNDAQYVTEKVQYADMDNWRIELSCDCEMLQVVYI